MKIVSNGHTIKWASDVYRIITHTHTKMALAIQLKMDVAIKGNVSSALFDLGYILCIHSTVILTPRIIKAKIGAAF